MLEQFFGKTRSVQDLIGIKTFTKYGLATNKEELLFYMVSPTNISVLSKDAITTKIRQLMLVLNTKPNLEFVCTDASECFDNNKVYLTERIDEEPNPLIKSLLAKDHEFLDNIQLEMAIKGMHEPIVTEAEYAKVMSIIGSRIVTSDEGKKTKGIRDHTDVWGNVLVCSCGKKFRRVKYHTPKGTEKRCAYQCGGQLTTGSVSSRLKKGLPIDGVCDSQFVQDWKLDVMAATIFKQFFENPQAVIMYANELLEAKTDAVSKEQEKEKEIKRIRSEMDKVEKKIANLLDLRLSDDISRDEYVAKRVELEKLLVESNEKINELENYEKIEEGIEDRAKMIKNIIEDRGKYDFTHIPDEIIDAFVDKVVVHKDYFEWHLRFDNTSKMKVAINGNKKHHGITCETTRDVSGTTGCNQAQKVIVTIK